MKILIINGPNMNMLGIREPDKYGNKTYDDLIKYIRENTPGEHELLFFQSNHEGEIVERIQNAYFEKVEAIIINPAAYTHTSIAIPDAIAATGIKTIEVHLTDIENREEYRKISYLQGVREMQISGKGFYGYLLAIKELLQS